MAAQPARRPVGTAWSIYSLVRNRHRAPFNPEAFIAKMGVGRTTKTYTAEQIVFAQGDAADAVFYIQKGQLKLSVMSDQGKEAIIAVLGADEFFGEACLAGQSRRLATASAMSDCAIVCMDRTAAASPCITRQANRGRLRQGT